MRNRSAIRISANADAPFRGTSANLRQQEAETLVACSRPSPLSVPRHPPEARRPCPSVNSNPARRASPAACASAAGGGESASRCGCPTGPSGTTCTWHSRGSGARSPSTPASARGAPPRSAPGRRDGLRPRVQGHQARGDPRARGGAGHAEKVGEADCDALRASEPAADASAPEAPCVASAHPREPRPVAPEARRPRPARDRRGTPRAVAAGFGYDAAGDGVVLGMLPLCGVFGYDSALGALAGGARVVLQEAFDGGRGGAAGGAPRVTRANGSDAMVLRLLEAAPDPPLREAGFAAFDGDPRAVVDAADAPARRPTCVTARPRSRRCSRTRRRTARPSGARSPGAPRLAGDRGAGLRRRRARDPRPERDGRLPRRRAARAHVRRLPPDRRPRPRHRRTASPSRPRGDTLRLGGFLVRPREIEGFLEQGDDGAEAAVVAVDHEGAQRPVASVVARGGAG